MKKILLSFTLVLFLIAARAQVPADTSALRAAINSWIVTNGNKQITAVQINNLFNSVVNLMTKYSFNGAYRINDTLFLTGPGMTPVKVTLVSGAGGTETDPTVPSVVKAISSTDIANWNGKQSALSGDGLTIDIITGVISAKNTTAKWNANQLQGHAIATTNPTNGQGLVWNNSTSQYEPATIAGGEPVITAPNAIKKYWNGYKDFVDFLSDSIPEGSINKYYTDARARAALSLTTIGTTGASTYNPATGVLNIPVPTVGGGSGIGTDSTIVITSGTSSTVTNGYNIIRFNPAAAISDYTLTLPAIWHTSNSILIVFGGTVTTGTVVTNLHVVNGSGQTLLQMESPWTGNAGQVISYKLISGTIDQRIL